MSLDVLQMSLNRPQKGMTRCGRKHQGADDAAGRFVIRSGLLEAFENGVGVRSTETEAVHAGASRNAMCQLRPGNRGRGDLQRAVELLDGWVELVEVQIWRDSAVLDGEECLHDASQAGTALQVSDDGLDRANVQRMIVGVRAGCNCEGLADGARLDGITCRRSCTVALD